MDRLTAMEVFIKVVDLGSFAGAARELDISKTMVTRHVQSLERRLGARLLNRTTRSLRLTEVGGAYYERCVRILADLAATERAVSDIRSKPRGRLRVVAPMNYGARHLVPVVFEYMAAYPEVTVDLTLDDRHVNLIEEGYDVAIRMGRIADPSLIVRMLASTTLVVCGAPTYFRANGRPRRPADLVQHDCLVSSLGSDHEEWWFEGPDGTETVQVSGSIRSNSVEVLTQAARNAFGLILQPSCLVQRDLAAGTLEPVLAEYGPAEAAIQAVYPRSRHLSAKVRTFVDFLAERLVMRGEAGPLPVLLDLKQSA